MPSIKTLVGLCSDKNMGIELDLFIYGPGSGRPDRSPEGEASLEIFRVPNIDSMSLDTVLQRGRSHVWERDKLVSQSVSEMETTRPAPEGYIVSTRKESDIAFRQSLYHAEVVKVLSRARAFLYDYASETWQFALRAKDRIQFLGPDY